MRKLWLIPLLVVLFALRLRATGQFEIVQERVVTAHALSGHVQVAHDPSPIEGVHVEVCEPQWKKPIASTVTNAKGYFSFPKIKSPGLYYLRLSMPNYSLLKVKVKVEPSSQRTLRLSMYPGV